MKLLILESTVFCGKIKMPSNISTAHIYGGIPVFGTPVLEALVLEFLACILLFVDMVIVEGKTAWIKEL